MSDPLAEIEAKLDAELLRVQKAQQEFDEWANETREYLKGKQRDMYISGQISVSQYKELIDILEHYNEKDTALQEYACELLTFLSGPTR